MANEDIYHHGVKALVRNADGKILLLKVDPKRLIDVNQSYWDIPGGRIQRGGTVLDTLGREVLEETGIAELANPVHKGTMIANIRIPVGPNETVGLVLSIYECSIPESATISLSEEHLAYNWFSKEEASELLTVKYPSDFCALI